MCAGYIEGSQEWLMCVNDCIQNLTGGRVAGTSASSGKSGCSKCGSSGGASYPVIGGAAPSSAHGDCGCGGKCGEYGQDGDLAGEILGDEALGGEPPTPTTAANTFSDTQTINVGTLGTDLQILKSGTATNAPTLKTRQGQVNTTNNAATVIHAFTLNDNTSYFIDALVVGVRTGGAAGAAGDTVIAHLYEGVQRVGGGAAQRFALALGPIVDFVRKSNAACDFSTALSGNDAQITVTGDTNNNYTWNLASLKIMPLPF